MHFVFVVVLFGWGRTLSARYEQSCNGVTVRIEKVTMDRVMNGPAWFRKAYGSDWHK
jgi:hypothetical protein